jgi:hypothetical protein
LLWEEPAANHMGEELKLAFSPLWVWQKKGRGGVGGPCDQHKLDWFLGVGCRQTPTATTTTTTPPPPVPTCDVGKLTSSNPFSLSLSLSLSLSSYRLMTKLPPNALLGTSIIIKAPKAQANPPMCLCPDNTYLMDLTCILKTPFQFIYFLNI